MGNSTNKKDVQRKYELFKKVLGKSIIRGTNGYFWSSTLCRIYKELKGIEMKYDYTLSLKDLRKYTKSSRKFVLEGWNVRL